MIGLGGAPVRQIPLRPRWRPARLSQNPSGFLPPKDFKVVVVDSRGNPFFGVTVTLSDGQQQVTDGDGIATFTFPPRTDRVTATLDVNGTRLVKEGPTNQTLFVDIPVCGPAKLLTNTEILAILVGGGMAAGGAYWKVSALSTTGEIIVGAALFTAIYRHSCVW